MLQASNRALNFRPWMLHWTKGLLLLLFDDCDVDESPKLFVDKSKGLSSICKTFWCCFWLTLEFVWVLMTLEWLLRLLLLFAIATWSWSTLEVGSSLNSLISNIVINYRTVQLVLVIPNIKIIVIHLHLIRTTGLGLFRSNLKSRITGLGLFVSLKIDRITGLGLF